MPRALLRAAAALGATALALSLAAGPAVAHEQRTVGAYRFTVGWAHEPAYVDTQNAIQLFVHDANGNPVDDIGAPPTLQVQAVFGNLTSQLLELQPSFDPDTGFGTHGEFDAAITPTSPGNYTFHFTGSIRGQSIDQRFTSSDSTFDPVQDPAGIEFPSKDPTTHELGQSVQALLPRVDRARANASSAHRAANIADVLGGVAVVIALVVAGLSVRRARRTTVA